MWSYVCIDTSGSSYIQGQLLQPITVHDFTQTGTITASQTPLRRASARAALAHQAQGAVCRDFS